MQTITLDDVPVDRIQIIINGLVYKPNLTPGVTWTPGTTIVQWDDTHPELFRIETTTDPDLVIQEFR